MMYFKEAGGEAMVVVASPSWAYNNNKRASRYPGYGRLGGTAFHYVSHYIFCAISPDES